MKLTRFLLATNPIVEGSPSTIVHTRTPVTIFEIMDGLLVLHYSETPDINKVDKIRDRAYQWYKALLIHQGDKTKLTKAEQQWLDMKDDNFKKLTNR